MIVPIQGKILYLKPDLERHGVVITDLPWFGQVVSKLFDPSLTTTKAGDIHWCGPSATTPVISPDNVTDITKGLVPKEQVGFIAWLTLNYLHTLPTTIEWLYG